MIIKCPKNSRHKRFKTATAHVQQEWEVNNKGEYIKTINECIDVDHHPDEGDTFRCKTCDSYCEVFRTED